MPTVKEIFEFLNDLYPVSNAQTFDSGKIGLQFGNPDAQCDKIVLCLDATEKAIDYAIENNANLILAHHPFMFTPLVNLDYRTNMGRKLQKVLKNDLNIMAFHTNFDVGCDGMNDVLAEKLALNDIHYLTEEVNKDSLIRVGTIKPQKLSDFCKFVKKAFNLDGLRVAGCLEKEIKTVSIVGGSGSSEFFTAMKASDILITGQVPHHLGIEALENDFAIIEVSHAIEFYGLEMLKKKLSSKFNIEIVTFNDGFDPFKTI